MIKIILEAAGRRFNRDWIFKNISYTFTNNGAYAILGANGSGKSTLLAVVSGSLSASAGKVFYFDDDKSIDESLFYEKISLAAPYLELIEEFTLLEMINFHFRFKKRVNNIADEELLVLLQLEKHRNKEIKYFSSGMKQRVKLGLAFLSDTPVLLLDEPTANLDESSIKWYHNMVENYAKNRLTLVCSNQPHEYQFCTNFINLADYK